MSEQIEANDAHNFGHGLLIRNSLYGQSNIKFNQISSSHLQASYSNCARWSSAVAKGSITNSARGSVSNDSNAAIFSFDDEVTERLKSLDELTLKFDKALSLASVSPSVHSDSNTGSPNTLLNASSQLEALRALRSISKVPEAMFKKNQALLFSSVMHPERLSSGDNLVHAIHINTCGDGKTAAVLVGARDCNRTVFVLPTIALMHDVEKRLEEASISFFSTKSMKDLDSMDANVEDILRNEVEDLVSRLNGVRILLITPEKAIQARFFKAITQWKNNCLARDETVIIVFDEAHLLLAWSFRNAMILCTSYLVKLNLPMVYLTGTMSPSVEPFFRKQLGFTTTNLKTFRNFSNRPEISYISYQVPSGRTYIQEVSEILIKNVDYLKSENVVMYYTQKRKVCLSFISIFVFNFLLFI